GPGPRTRTRPDPAAKVASRPGADARTLRRPRRGPLCGRAPNVLVARARLRALRVIPRTAARATRPRADPPLRGDGPCAPARGGGPPVSTPATAPPAARR